MKNEISSGNNSRAKLALQFLDQEVRRGRVVPLDELAGLEMALLGALNSGASDEKVRRWSMNVLALVGRKEICLDPIKRVLNSFGDEPQVIASAVSCIFKFDTENALKFLRGKTTITPDLIQLSALQSVSAKKLDLRTTKIDIDIAPPEILKMALVLVGIDKAPNFIFDPKYENREIVKVLGGHHEPIVSQYSVWAASENGKLSTKDIGIDIGNIDGYPANVRSYTYRLYGSENEYSNLRHDIILRGCEDESHEARGGLAKGLKDSFYDGLEAVALEWWGRETDEEVQKLIVDHFIRQSSHSTSYTTLALELYEDQRNARDRERMEAMVAGRDIYTKFRKLSAEQEFGQLFGDTNVTNNYSINNLQSGVTSFGGNASNDGTVNLELSADNRQQAVKLLEEAREVLSRLPNDENTKLAEEAVAQAVAGPDKGRLARVVDSINKVKEGISGAEAATNSVASIGKILVGLSALL